MALFTVISWDDTDKVRDRIKEHFPNDNLALEDKPGITWVRGAKLTSEVAELLGFNDDEKRAGLVIKNEACYGYADAAIWEWANQNA